MSHNNEENIQKDTAKRRENFKNFIENDNPLFSAHPNETGMKPHERSKLIDFIHGMSREELVLVSETIPVELCYNRIGKELSMKKDLEHRISDLMETSKCYCV